MEEVFHYWHCLNEIAFPNVHLPVGIGIDKRGDRHLIDNNSALVARAAKTIRRDACLKSNKFQE